MLWFGRREAKPDPPELDPGIKAPQWFRDWSLANMGAQKFALENAHIKSGGKVFSSGPDVPYVPPGSTVTVNRGMSPITAGVLATALGAGTLGGGYLGGWFDKEQPTPPPAEIRARVLDADGNEVWSGDVPEDGRIPIELGD